MFEIEWVEEAIEVYQELEKRAQTSLLNRKKIKQKKSSRVEGLFKQITKTINLLKTNPRHPGLHTHEYDSMIHPFDPKQKIFEAYVQNNTPAAYRIFWCYGSTQKKITILAITPHP